MFLFWWLLSAHAQELVVPVEVKTQQGPLTQHTSSPVWRSFEEDLSAHSELHETLNKAPGLSTTQSGGMGGIGSLYSRGSESRHIIVLTDGFRLNDPSSTTRNFDSAFMYSPFFQELQFLRGPAPTLYGGDATGGVVELIPRRGARSRLTQLSLGVGSFDTYQGHALQDWSWSSSQGTLGLAHLETEGFSRLNKKRHGAVEADGAKTTQLTQASTHRWNSTLSTDLYLWGADSESEQDGFLNTGAGDDNDEDLTENRQAILGQTTRGQWAIGEWWLKSGLVAQKRATQSINSQDETFRGETQQWQLGNRASWGRHTALMGVELNHEWVSSNDLMKSNDLLAGFWLSRWQWERWRVEAGLRAERHQKYQEFVASEMTLSFHPDESLKYHWKTARGYKTPSLYQLYAPDTFGPLGNPELVPETNLSHELGLEWSGSGVLGMVFFQQSYNDLLSYSVANGYENQGQLLIRGIESFAMTPTHSWGELSLTWTQLDYSDYQQTPLRRPPYLVNLAWGKELDDWKIELGLRAVGGRKDNNGAGERTTLSAYELLYGSLRWRVDVRQEWRLRLGNITDRDYEDVWGYGVAPLNASLNWSFRI